MANVNIQDWNGLRPIPYCKTWVFAQNGTIAVDRLKSFHGEFIPIGTTDSEVIFCGFLS